MHYFNYFLVTAQTWSREHRSWRWRRGTGRGRDGWRWFKCEPGNGRRGMRAAHSLMNGGTWPGPYLLQHNNTVQVWAAGQVTASVTHPQVQVGGRETPARPSPSAASSPTRRKHGLCAHPGAVWVSCRADEVFCAVSPASLSYNSAPEVAKYGPSAGNQSWQTEIRPNSC